MNFSAAAFKKHLSVIILITAILIGGGYYFYYRELQANYVIPGVPYYGVYNSFLEADFPAVTSVADVLGYWGDSRFPLSALMKRLPSSITSTIDGVATQVPVVQNSLVLESFFKDNGYETYRWVPDGTGGELAQIKKFVNRQKKIPVIVYQKRSSDSSRTSSGFRVVIGVLEKNKKVIVHDHDFGNNYEISYDDFQKMFGSKEKVILAAWPSEALKQQIKGPNYDVKYPERMQIMDVFGSALMKSADALVTLRNWNKNSCERAAPMYKEAIDDMEKSEIMEQIPPSHRIIFYQGLANIYLCFNKSDEAIDIITDKVLSLNHNLNEPFNGWTEQVSFFKENNITSGKFARPYYILGKAYLQKNILNKAKANFEEALKINPYHSWSREELEKLK